MYHSIIYRNMIYEESISNLLNISDNPVFNQNKLLETCWKESVRMIKINEK